MIDEQKKAATRHAEWYKKYSYDVRNAAEKIKAYVEDNLPVSLSLVNTFLKDKKFIEGAQLVARESKKEKFKAAAKDMFGETDFWPKVDAWTESILKSTEISKNFYNKTA